MAETISIGRGAIVAAISTLVISSRRPGGFSHRQPPCMCSEIMLTGTATLTRGSTAASEERLRAAAGLAGHADARRAGRTGSVSRKSSARMPFHNCSPARLRPHRFSRRPPKVCGSCWLSL